MKFSVELNSAPKQNMRFSSSLQCFAGLIKTVCNTKRLHKKFGKRKKKRKKSKGPECHLTFTHERDNESRYIICRIIPNIGVTCVVLAEGVAAVNKVKVVLEYKHWL